MPFSPLVFGHVRDVQAPFSRCVLTVQYTGTTGHITDSSDRISVFESRVGSFFRSAKRVED